MLYIFDASAIVSVQFCTADTNVLLEEMAERLNRGELCFCNEVLEELKRLAREEAPLAWAVASGPNRAHKGAPYNYIAWVLDQIPEIVDDSARDTQEPAGPYVLAQALELHRTQKQVTVVTADLYAKPTRTCLKDACAQLGIRCISLDEYVAEVGV